MKVKIISLDDGSHVSEMLDVYKGYNPQNQTSDQFPFAKIHQEDFFECCKNPEKAFDKYLAGESVFDVKIMDVELKAKLIYKPY